MNDILAFADGVSPFDVIRKTDDSGEYWSARALQLLMAYPRWQHFKAAIDRAQAAARNVGDCTAVFTVDRENPSELGGRPREDFRLTRAAAYYVAMNGDPRKSEVAAAQTYFVHQTRAAEVTQELERKARAWEVLASEGGDYSVRELAFMLNRDDDISTGQNSLFKLLRQLGMIDRRNRPYAKHKNHLVLRMGAEYTDAEGQVQTGRAQVRVTPRGVQYIHRRLSA